MTKKKIDLGEYVVTIQYDNETGRLDVYVLDEAGDMIEGINIANDDEDDTSTGIGFNLN